MIRAALRGAHWLKTPDRFPVAPVGLGMPEGVFSLGARTMMVRPVFYGRAFQPSTYRPERCLGRHHHVPHS